MNTIGGAEWDKDTAERVRSMLTYMGDEAIAKHLRISLDKVRSARRRYESRHLGGQRKAENPSYIKDDTESEADRQERNTAGGNRLLQAQMRYFHKRAAAWNMTVEMVMATIHGGKDIDFNRWLESKVA